MARATQSSRPEFSNQGRTDDGWIANDAAATATATSTKAAITNAARDAILQSVGS